jgi:hypothetical protein
VPVPTTRTFLLGLLAAWLGAALLLYWLDSRLAATYLVASGWLACGGLVVWALVRWPPFKRQILKRRGGPRVPPPPAG